MLQISLPAEKVASIGTFPVTNTLLTTWLVMIFLILLSFITYSRLQEIPGRFQIIMEFMVGGLFGLFQSVTGIKTKTYFPLLGTIFIFVLFVNFTDVLPGVGTIGLQKIAEGTKEFIPLFRPGSADLNFTLALAIISFLMTEYFGLRTLGIGYLKKFINLHNPMMFFVGLLDIISELSHIISFAFRLFGNIFAGEVLLTVIAFLVPLIAPIPFLGMEMFVSFIQALVFSILTAVFINVATSVEH